MRGKKTKKSQRLYKNLGKGGSEAGSGRITATKHGRDIRHGVFQIGTAGVKKGCFAFALLVGTSFLNQDTNYKK